MSRSEEEVAKPNAPAAVRVEPRDTVHEVAKWLSKLTPGDLQSLVRNDRSGPSGPYWRLTHEVLEPRGAFSGVSLPIQESERRWAIIASLMAALVGDNLLRRNVRAGLVLASFLKEARFTALIHRNGPALEVLLRTTTGFARSKGAAFDFSDLAELLLTDLTPNEKIPRVRLARDFYRALRK